LPPTILASDAVQRLFDELLVIVTPRSGDAAFQKKCLGQ
jgi:hypothetical protein